MTTLTKTLTKHLLTLLLGIAIGAGILFIVQLNSVEPIEQNNDQQKPLYWVAPMDDNYRRDKPGKSPMGMDLVPVYQQSQSTQSSEQGVVRIAPHVVNNLGVRTAKVAETSMHTRIFTVGYVQYDEDKLVHIHPRVDGWVEQLFVKASGDPVEKDQPLYTLYSPELVNAQEELLIAIKRKNKTLIVAARERLQALQLPLSFIKRLEKSQKVQQTVTFYAPQSGVINGLKIREGFFVKPGNTLMSIAQLDQVWVEAEVFERDAILVKAGLPVVMSLDYLPGQQWQGQVDYVYPTLNPQTRTLRIRLKFANPELTLKPNMFAQVIIHANSIDDALLVPKESVIRTGKQDRVVLALGEGQFKSVEVAIGRVNHDHIEILNGVNEGDVVVTSAQFLIDSESSKSSDFRRINSAPAEENHLMQHRDDHQKMSEKSDVSTAQVNGVINAVDSENRVLTISREAIEKWQRPAATMDFLVAKHIDLNALAVGMNINFVFEVHDDLVVVELKVMSALDKASNSVTKSVSSSAPTSAPVPQHAHH
ncbi:efflux RND transporter periplasmic adaptor subunit [Thalassotalea sp. PLHSN55]|uniref:efflux RND transporter periplasmic adaptor subunit n=1 Tax=Thalassotalea sp. PLHSN55 TaxID=3435888 RepID=UPI003F847DD3